MRHQSGRDTKALGLKRTRYNDSPANSTDPRFETDHELPVDLEDDLVSCKQSGPFTFDSKSPVNVEGVGLDMSGCSFTEHEIPNFPVDLDKDVIVNKRNRLKASLEK